MNKRSGGIEGKVLIITQEMQPYLEVSLAGTIIRDLLAQLKQHNYEARVMMPRFGRINEKKHRLHEVVRLSGMNITIGDDDYSLLIKVATLPEVRMQIYFMDNDEIFEKDYVFRDEFSQFLPNNGLRMTFFARSVCEVLKKLGWEPDIIHINGWFSTLVPLFIRRIYADEPMFKKARLILSVYDDYFPEKLEEGWPEVIKVEDVITDEDLEMYKEGTYEALYYAAATLSDGIIIASEFIEPAFEKRLKEHAEQTGKPFMKLQDALDLKPFVEEHISFYRQLQHDEVAS